MPGIQSKITRLTKRQENVILIENTESLAVGWSNPEVAQMLELAEKGMETCSECSIDQ